MRRKFKNYVAGGIVFAFLLTLVLPAYLYFNTSQVTAAPGDGTMATYGIAANGDGNPEVKDTDIKSAVWNDAASITVTFANDLTVTLTPLNDADNGQGELKDQRIDSRNGGGSVDFGTTETGCYARMSADLDETKDVVDFIMTEIASMRFDFDFRESVAGECLDGNEPTIQMQQSRLSVAYFKWIDSGAIASADDSQTFTKVEGGNFYIKDSEAGKSCRDKLLVDTSTNPNTVRYWELDSDYSGDPPSEAQAADCDYNNSTGAFPPSNRVMPLGGEANKDKEPGTGDRSSLISVGGEEPPSCESSGGPLSWLMCGVINLLAGATDAIHDNMILPLLKNPRVDTQDTDSGAYRAWTSFRNIANIVIMFGLLFVVFGQSLGLDAYTAKKMMPKILLAAILANLSFYLISIANDITTILGGGISALIKAPFEINSDFSFEVGGGVGTLGLLTLFGAGAAAWAVVGPGQIIMALFAFVLLPVFLAILGAAVVLVLRRGILLLLLIISPVAFSLLAIPGGDKYLKKYRELLFSTLLVYPLFEAIWAISQVLAVTISEANGRESIIGIFTTLIALFAPLFMIPFAFKMAGGVLATVGAITNDKGRGLIDRSKKASSAGLGNAAKRTFSGQRYRGQADDGSFKGNMNRRLGRLGTLGREIKTEGAGYALKPSGFRERLDSAEEAHLNLEAAHEDKDNTAIASFKADDTVLKAGIHGRTAEEVRQHLINSGEERFQDRVNLEKTVANVMRAKRSMSTEVFQRVATNALAPTGTAFADTDEMLHYINMAYGSDRAGAGSALAAMRSASMQAGRVDLGAAGYGAMAGEMQNLYTAQQAAVAQLQRSGQPVTAEAVTTLMAPQMEASRNVIKRSAIRSSAAGQALYGKAVSAGNIGEGWALEIDDIMARVSDASAPPEARQVAERELSQALASVAGIHQQMSSVSPDNAKAFADAVMGRGLVVSSMAEATPEMSRFAAKIDPGNQTREVRNVTDPATGNVQRDTNGRIVTEEVVTIGRGQDRKQIITIIDPATNEPAKDEQGKVRTREVPAPGPAGITIKDAIERLRQTDKDFNEISREYGNSMQEEANRARQQPGANAIPDPIPRI